MCKVNIADWEVKTYSAPNDINSGGATLAFVGQNAAVIFGGTLYKCQSVSDLPVPADKCEIEKKITLLIQLMLVDLTGFFAQSAKSGISPCSQRL